MSSNLYLSLKLIYQLCNEYDVNRTAENWQFVPTEEMKEQMTL